MTGFAWVTLATNDSYCLGALVLAHSLRRVNTAHQLAILITPGVSQAMRTQLNGVFQFVKEVDVLDSRDEPNLRLLARPELGITFTKLHCWTLTQFDKCIFLDADTLVLQNCDELFEREEFSAAPDAGWPDCFNTGVFVYKPSNETFQQLIDFALKHGSFDGGDQGLLNQFFSDWATKDICKHLPFVYNMCSTATYSYLPAFKQFGDQLKIVHFIGSTKPWLQPFDAQTGLARVSTDSTNLGTFIQFWWDLFCKHIHPHLSTEMAGLAGALSNIRLGSSQEADQIALEEHLRQRGWEEGNIDYMGRDSFDNIWRKICQTLAASPTSPPLVSTETPTPAQPIPLSPSQSAVPPSPPTPLAVFPSPQIQSADPPSPPIQSAIPPSPPIQSAVPSSPPIPSAVPSSPPITPDVPLSPPIDSAVQPPSPPIVQSTVLPTSIQSSVSSSQPIESAVAPQLIQSDVIPSSPIQSPIPQFPAVQPAVPLSPLIQAADLPSPHTETAVTPSQPESIVPPQVETAIPFSLPVEPAVPSSIFPPSFVPTSPPPAVTIPPSPPVVPAQPNVPPSPTVEPPTPPVTASDSPPSELVEPLPISPDEASPLEAAPSIPVVDDPPVPPKRKGGSKGSAQSEASKSQPKGGGKQGKGKK